jgi:hypothetical protein
MKTNTTILILLLTLMAASSCKKNHPDPIQDKVDYREKYYGDYAFEAVIRSWSMSSGVSWDTSFYNGLIRKYQLSDSDSNWCAGAIDAHPNPNEKISLHFRQNMTITSGISEEGLLMPKTCYHYYHKGGFTHHDTISFYLTGLGGLGGGATMWVTGIRK